MFIAKKSKNTLRLRPTSVHYTAETKREEQVKTELKIEEKEEKELPQNIKETILEEEKPKINRQRKHKSVVTNVEQIENNLDENF